MNLCDRLHTELSICSGAKEFSEGYVSKCAMGPEGKMRKFLVYPCICRCPHHVSCTLIHPFFNDISFYLVLPLKNPRKDVDMFMIFLPCRLYMRLRERVK